MSKCCNNKAIHEVIGRVLNGQTVEFYIVKNRVTKAELKLEKALVEQMALNKQLYNCYAQVYNDIVNMRGINCKLNQLPKYNNEGKLIEVKKQEFKSEALFSLIGKVQNGRVISDYIVVSINEPLKKMKVPKDVVINLALDGKITNAKVQMNNGDYMLRGVKGMNLSQLDLYR